MDAFLNRKSILFLFLLCGPLLFLGCGQSKSAGTVFPETSASCHATAHPNRYIVKKENGAIEIQTASSREQLLENYVEPNLQDIAFVEADQKINKYAITTAPTTDLKIWGPQRMKASVAWNQKIFGEGVKVAVVDAGVDIEHEAFKNAIDFNIQEVMGQKDVDDDRNGFIDDVAGWNFVNGSPQNNDEDGHGSHVTGIIAASHNSLVLGMAPAAKIIPLDFMDSEGGLTSGGILSIRYAIQQGAQIINASWGSTQCSRLLEQEVNGLAEKNILFIAAAGNDARNLSFSPEYPAAYESETQITVSALSVRGVMTWFTNYGAPSQIMAPGESIYSSIAGNKYEFLNGTSMAAPMVSGMAALILSAYPKLTALSLKKIILDSVSKGPFDVASRGEANVAAALELAKNRSEEIVSEQLFKK